jgi:hypothetical protein
MTAEQNVLNSENSSKPVRNSSRELMDATTQKEEMKTVFLSFRNAGIWNDLQI